MMMIMGSSSPVRCALLFLALASSCSCYQQQIFYVGEKDGWVKDPSENYTHWAERNRFHVHDKLVFKYKKGKDSVLEVSKEKYESCTRTGAMRKMTSGESVFEFDSAGRFYFISGKGGHCEKGQKMEVEVAAAPCPAASPSPAPAPSASPALGAASLLLLPSLALWFCYG